MATGPTEPIIFPRCPHCGEDLAGMGLFMWQVQGWLIVSPHCPNPDCRVVLHTQAVPVPPQTVEAEPTRIARPS